MLEKGAIGAIELINSGLLISTLDFFSLPEIVIGFAKNLRQHTLVSGFQGRETSYFQIS